MLRYLIYGHVLYEHDISQYLTISRRSSTVYTFPYKGIMEHIPVFMSGDTRAAHIVMASSAMLCGFSFLRAMSRVFCSWSGCREKLYREIWLRSPIHISNGVWKLCSLIQNDRTFFIMD